MEKPSKPSSTTSTLTSERQSRLRSKAQLRKAVKRELKKFLQEGLLQPVPGSLVELKEPPSEVTPDPLQQEIDDRREFLVEMFEQFYVRPGPVARIVTEGARRIAHGKSVEAVVDDIYDSVIDAVYAEARQGDGP